MSQIIDFLFAALVNGRGHSAGQAIRWNAAGTAYEWYTPAVYAADETTLHLSGGVFSVLGTYAGQSSIVTVGTLTGGATGAGFTIALTTSTVTGTLPAANLPSFGSGD